MAADNIPFDGIGDEVLNGLRQFLGNCNANRLGKGLRNILIDYIRLQFEVLPLGFEDLLTDIYALFEFLDSVDAYQLREGHK